MGVLDFGDFGEIINNNREFAGKKEKIVDNNVMICVLGHAVGGEHLVASRLSEGILCVNHISCLNGLLPGLGLLALRG